MNPAVFKPFRSGALQPLLIVVAVALGVAVVTAMTAYIESSYRQQAIVQNGLSFREITLLSKTEDPGVFSSGEPLPTRIGSAAIKPVILTATDLEGVQDAAPSVDYAYIDEYHGGILGDRPYSVNAVTADYLTATGIQVTEGSTLAPSDFREQRPVMLITSEGAAQASITADPIGRTFSDPFDNRAYTIVGLLPSSDDPNAVQAIVPYKPLAAASDFQVTPDQVYQLKFAVEDTSKLATARAEIEAYARKTWGEGVSVLSQNLAAVQESARVTSLFVAVFASLGLLVASFNILNLFLAQVRRRGRELAIRRTLGADRWTVRREVLLEAATLGLLGGLLGAAAGYGLVAAFNSYVQQATEGAWPSIVLSLPVVFGGVVLALVMSLVFSFYPALLASRVQIRDALGEN